MAEETGKHEGEGIEADKVDYVCRCCGKQVEAVYFYCEECHKTQEGIHRKEQIEQKEEVNEKGESENDKG